MKKAAGRSVAKTPSRRPLQRLPSPKRASYGCHLFPLCLPCHFKPLGVYCFGHLDVSFSGIFQAKVFSTRDTRRNPVLWGLSHNLLPAAESPLGGAQIRSLRVHTIRGSTPFSQGSSGHPICLAAGASDFEKSSRQNPAQTVTGVAVIFSHLVRHVRQLLFTVSVTVMCLFLKGFQPPKLDRTRAKDTKTQRNASISP